MNPEKSYFICATQRSGSTLLCEALQNTKLAGNPEENYILWLRETNRSDDRDASKALFRDYLTRGTGENGVFGTKMMWNYFPAVVEKLKEVFQIEARDVSVTQVLQQLFPNLKFIHLVRKDLVRQAISHWRIERTRVHHVRNETDRLRLQQANKALEFDLTRICYFHSLALGHRMGWEQFFKENNIQPFRIVYEDFVESYWKTAVATLNFLDIPGSKDIVPGERKMKPLADDLTVKWQERYNRELKQIKAHVNPVTVKDIPSDASIYIFGAGEAGRLAYEAIKEEQPEKRIKGFIDSRKRGEFIGLPVFHIDDIGRQALQPVEIVVSSYFWPEISYSLIEKGFSGFNVLFLPGTEPGANILG